MSANVSNGAVVTTIVLVCALAIGVGIFISGYLGNRAYFEEECVEVHDGIVIEDRSGDLICIDSAVVVWP